MINLVIPEGKACPVSHLDINSSADCFVSRSSLKCPTLFGRTKNTLNVNICHDVLGWFTTEDAMVKF